jgi:hypothetical protein
VEEAIAHADTGMVSYIERCVFKVWCVACVISVEVAMLPGAALSIVATATIVALGGRFEHRPVKVDYCAAQQDHHIADPIIVLFHGHGFNAAMWGRFVVSLSLAGYATVCVNYELQSLMMNAPASHESIADLAALVEQQLAAKMVREGGGRSSSGLRRHPGLQPAIFCGHSLGGLVATHLAANGRSKNCGLDVQGVIAIATPFGGVPLLTLLAPLIPWLPSFLMPCKCVMEMQPNSICATLREAASRHAMQGCSYRCIAGWCDLVVPPSAAFVETGNEDSGMHLGTQKSSTELSSSIATLLLCNEGHFTITMSDRLIATVIQWIADILAKPKCSDYAVPSKHE